MTGSLDPPGKVLTGPKTPARKRSHLHQHHFPPTPISKKPQRISIQIVVRKLIVLKKEVVVKKGLEVVAMKETSVVKAATVVTKKAAVTKGQSTDGDWMAVSNCAWNCIWRKGRGLIFTNGFSLSGQVRLYHRFRKEKW